MLSFYLLNAILLNCCETLADNHKLLKRSDLVHWEDLEGASGGGGGRGDRDGEHM